MDLDPDPALFVIDLEDANKQQIFSKFFCLVLFEGTFTSFFKIKSQKEVTKQKESRFCLLFFLDDRRIRRPKNTGTDPTDPDPQNW
jgi:hypothetical protein